MFNNSNVRLVDVKVRDAQGKPTGQIKGRPEFVVMLDPAVYRENEADLAAYFHVPEHVDEEWAGMQTIYVKFNTKAQAEALLKKYLA